MLIPPGFNVTALFADYIAVCAPIVGVLFIVAVFTLINKIMKRG